MADHLRCQWVRVPAKLSSGDSEARLCLSSRSGTVHRPSTGDPGLDWWMLSLEDSHAGTSAQPARELG